MFTDKEFEVAEEVLDAYLRAWSDGEYEDAYDLLATTSPLRQGLTRDAWAIRHRSWAEDAHPERMRFEIVLDSELDIQAMLPPHEGKPPATESDQLEVFWSLEMAETPLSRTLNDLPTATAVYQQVGRHWFWVSFTMLEEDGTWRVHSMIDEGAATLRMSVETLNERMERLGEVVKQLAKEFGVSDVAELEDEQRINDIIDKMGTDDFPFEDVFDHVEEIRWITIRGMHYSDGLIARQPEEAQVYDTAVAQATSIDEWERAGSYLDLIIQRFPEERGQALRILSIALSHLIAESSPERATQFEGLVEKTLRAAIEADSAPQSYIMLADLFLNREEHLDEARSLLSEARARASETEDIASIEYSQGRLAETEDKLEEARTHYQQAVKLDASLPGLWASLGYVQRALGQVPQAIESYKHAIETDDEDSDPYVELANLYIEQQKPDAAGKVLEQGLTLFPENADLYATFTIVALQSGDMPSAEEYLNIAEEIDSDSEIVQDARLVFDMIKAQQKTSKSHPKGKNKPKKKKR
jgi:tetratricopeptide (TPR) repeat protein